MAKVAFVIEDKLDDNGQPTGDVSVVTEGYVASEGQGTPAEQLGMVVASILIRAAGLDWDDVATPVEFKN